MTATPKKIIDYINNLEDPKLYTLLDMVTLLKSEFDGDVLAALRTVVEDTYYHNFIRVLPVTESVLVGRSVQINRKEAKKKVKAIESDTGVKAIHRGGEYQIFYKDKIIGLMSYDYIYKNDAATVVEYIQDLKRKA